MGVVYSGVDGIHAPEWESGEDYKDHIKREERYEQNLINYALIHGKGGYRGKIVQFPHADGYARYLVLSLRPLRLVHIATGDAWHYPYIERLTAKDITDKIDQDARWKALFSKKS